MKLATKINKGLLKKLAISYKEMTGHQLEPLRKYKVGERVFFEGQVPKGVYYLSKGLVKILYEDEGGSDAVLRIAGPNNFICYVSLIKKWDYTSTAVVVEKAEIQFIPKRVFLKLLQTDVHFSNAVLETLCEQLHEGDSKIYSFIIKNAKQRIAAFLLSLELAYNQDDRLTNPIIKLSKKDIASAVAITPETLSRYLSEFKKKGIINSTYGGIEILNRNILLNMIGLND